MSISIAIITKFTDIAHMFEKRAKNYFLSYRN